MTETTAERETPIGSYVLLVLGSAGYFCFMYAWFSLPAFLTEIIPELGLSSTEAGVLTGAIPLVYIPLGLASGLVVDRIGSGRALGIGLVLLGGAHAARGMAPGFPTMLALTLVIGVGGTGLTFGLPKLVSDLFAPERSGTMSSVYLVGSYVGTAAAFGVGRPILGPALGGWRPAFVWGGLAVVAFGLAWLAAARWLTVRDPRIGAIGDDGVGAGHEGGDGDGDGDGDGNGDDDGGEAGEPSFSLDSLRRDVRSVVSHRDLRLVVVVGTMYLLVLHGLQAWLQTVLEVRGFAVGVAAVVTSLLIGARIAGTVVIPPLSDRLGMRRGMIVVCGALCTLGTVGLVTTGTALAATVVAVAVVGVGLGGLSPLIRAIPIELDGIGPRLTATATGLIYAIGEIGGFSGPFLVGALRDVTGSYGTGIAILGAGGLLVILAGLRMSEPGRAE